MATLRAARAVIAFNFVDTGKSFKEEPLLGRLEGWAGRKKEPFRCSMRESGQLVFWNIC
jgi:hypothetical protein